MLLVEPSTVIQHLRLPRIIPGNYTFNCEDEDLERRDPMPASRVLRTYLNVDERAIYDAKMVEESRVFGSSFPYS